MGLKRAFFGWLRRQQQIRDYFHNEAGACDHSDVPCLRAHYYKVVQVERRIRRNRKMYAHRIIVCDECAPIKLRFENWLSHQLQRRRLLRLQILLHCEADDHECMSRRIHRIRRINLQIALRRAHVLRLHNDCIKTTTAPTTAARTAAPVRLDSTRAGFASFVAPSLMLIAAIVLALIMA